uniref:Polyprotein protein n=1 Tax=Solanum tuberosum TaxID=4113 RepID=M1DGS2_SOLTU
MSMIFGTVEIPDMPVEPDIPSATTVDEVRVDEAADSESEAETDKEMLGVAEEVSYEGLKETEEAMIDAVVQTSLVDMPLADPSGAGDTVDATSGIDAQEKIKSAREMSSRHVTERFRDAVLDCPKLRNLRMLKAKAKRRWN